MRLVEGLIKVLSFIAALTVLVNISFLELNLGYSYYFILTITLLIILIIGKKPRWNFLMLWLLISIIISISINNIPVVFKPFQRFAAFTIIISLVGPLFKTSKLNVFKGQLFKTLNTLIIVLVMFSFVGIVLNLPFVYGLGGFVGFFNHSMTLGPMAAISSLICVNWANISKSKRMSLLYYLIAALSMLTCIMAGSRAALLSAIFGIFFYYLKSNNLVKGIKIFFLIAVLGLGTFPLWEQYTERLLWKMEYAKDKGDITATRTSLWENRLMEFGNSPIFGVGFANDSTQSQNDLLSGDGKVEPGSSWLAIIAMTGLAGFIPFALLFVSILYFTYTCKYFKDDLSLLGGLLIFFGIHMFAEGYVFSAGSGLFFYLWLLLGVTSIYRDKLIRTV